MPAFFHDDVLDGGMAVVVAASSRVLHVCSGTPASRSAVLSSSLASVSLSSSDLAVGNASPDGRGLTVAAKSGVTVGADGTPAHFCVVDGARLLLRAEVNASSPDLVSGSTVDVPSVNFSFADPVSV